MRKKKGRRRKKSKHTLSDMLWLENNTVATGSDMHEAFTLSAWNVSL